jgi:hypothetical protein
MHSGFEHTNKLAESPISCLDWFFCFCLAGQDSRGTAPGLGTVLDDNCPQVDFGDIPAAASNTYWRVVIVPKVIVPLYCINALGFLVKSQVAEST